MFSSMGSEEFRQLKKAKQNSNFAYQTFNPVSTQQDHRVFRTIENEQEPFSLAVNETRK